MNATIHIRISDEEKWKAIPNKSEFIHNALNMPSHKTVREGERLLPIYERVAGRRIKRAEVVVAGPFTEGEFEALEKAGTVKRDIKLCKHGADPKFCRFAKAGKPCK